MPLSHSPWILLDQLFPSQRPLFCLSNRPWNPPVDVTETPECVRIRMEIAGIRPPEIAVTIEKGVLSIRGQRRDRKPSEDEALHVMEIHYGCFERSFVLPPNIDENGAKATYSHGFLEIEIPKGQGSGSQTRIAVEDS